MTTDRWQQSVSEVVRAALRPFQRRQAVLDAEIDRARRIIEDGADVVPSATL